MMDATHAILFLVRHGQNQAGAADAMGPGLSNAGRRQIALLADRLAGCTFTAIHHSTLRRAAESAEILAEKFPGVPVIGTELLWEGKPGFPADLAPLFKDLSPAQLQADLERANQAFDAYFTLDGGPFRHELIVCHGNLIRFFVSRLFRAPEGSWVYADIHNASLTEIHLQPGGLRKVVTYNDTAHLPPDLRTYL